MIEFRTLHDHHPDLAHSPMLRAALLTLRYAHERGAIGLIKTKAFKRVFVHWAVENFAWPGKSAEEMLRYSKAGLLVQTLEEREGKVVHHVFKTPLWRSAMKLDTDDRLRPRFRSLEDRWALLIGAHWQAAW